MNKIQIIFTNSLTFLVTLVSDNGPFVSDFLYSLHLSDYYVLNACHFCGQTADRNSSLCKFETLTALYFVKEFVSTCVRTDASPPCSY